MTEEEKALLDAIAREPGEDLHRLAYADWLTENGAPNRAELIRLQCGLERGVDWQSGEKATAERMKELKGREKELVKGLLARPLLGKRPSIREFTPKIAEVVAYQPSGLSQLKSRIG